MLRAFGAAGWVMAILAIVQSSAALAQLDQAVSDKDLLEPWTRAAAVVLSLAESFDTPPRSHEPGERDQRAQIGRGLDQLDDGLARLQAQQETVAVRIAADPSFSYDASLRSFEMSAQVAEIAESFDAVASDLSAAQRADVRAAHEAIDRLRRILSERNHLERDVLRALGSGGKHEIQALAARWWNAAEGVGSLRDAIAQARNRLTDAPAERRN